MDSDGERIQALKEKWKALQLDLASRAICTDSDLSFTSHPARPIASPQGAEDYEWPIVRQLSCTIDGLHTVAGLDISFHKSTKEKAVATVAVLSFPELRVSAALRDYTPLLIQ